MQNFFHDGGFSFTGVTGAVIEQMEKYASGKWTLVIS